MVTKKFTYNELRTLKNEILGLAHIQEDGTRKIFLVGLKNEEVTLGISHRLHTIVLKMEEHFNTLENELKEILGDENDEQARNRRVNLWAQEVTISFEPILFEKIEDLVLRKNYLGEKHDYEFLIQSVCQE